MTDVVIAEPEIQELIIASEDSAANVTIATEEQVEVIMLGDDYGGLILDSGDSGPVSVEAEPEPTVITIEKIEVGPQGRPGPAGATIVRYPAAIALGGHRIVVLNENAMLEYADNRIPTHGVKILGMTTGAAVEGATVTVQTHGEIDEASWSWELDIPVWLGEEGKMTQVQPSAGYSLIVGFPITSTRLFLDIREPIFLI